MSEGFKYVERKKISKAQKRRDAKEANRKEMIKRIEEGENKHEHEERRIEHEKFDQLLADHKLRIHQIDADGDCLYRAIEHQLRLAPDSDERFSFQDIRDRTSQYMLGHSEDFMPFLTNDRGDTMSKSEFDAYCKRVSSTKEWGGHIELTAIAQFLRKPIHIFQADQVKPILIEPNQKSDKRPILLSFHKHLYHLGEHYNSLVIDET